jgi:6-pyruvoyl-tetrahydropterin synthase
MRETSLFLGRLTVIDFSYLDAQRGLLGESWIADVELSGNLDDEGVIFDFGDAKKKIKSILDNSIDHSLVVPLKSKNLEQTKSELKFSYANSAKCLRISAPDSSFFFAEVETVTIDTLTPILEDILLAEMPKNVNSVKLSLKTELIETPFYHYSHGLKKHDGNCQRIAHGHRSKLDVFINGVFALSWVKYYADLFKDSYFITREDIVSETDLNYELEYKATQGQFSLALPKENCILMKNETTVEQIAHFIADEIKAKLPKDQIKVKAYEGVEKGAIATRV